MKKTIIFITAMLISAAAFTGCNSSLDDSNTSVKPDSSKSFKQDTEASANSEKIVVDPFENMAITFSDESVYPDYFDITFDASNTPFGQEMSFTFFVDSADINGIVIKAKADIDDVDDIVEENNYTVNEIEKTFTFSTSELTSRFLSTEQFTDENIEAIATKMKNEIIEHLDSADENTVFTLQRLFSVIPKNDIEFEPQKRKIDTKLKLDENSFEDKYINTCEFKIISQVSYHTAGIFTDENGKYFTVILKSKLNNDSLLDESHCELLKPFRGNDDTSYMFSGEEGAYNTGLSIIRNSLDENTELVEIALDK